MALRKADARDPRNSLNPNGGSWSPWRHLAVAESYPQSVAAFVLKAIGKAPRRVLEVGCGDGYLALDLARGGHSVIGLEPDDDRLRIARRTLANSPQAGMGTLSYVAEDLASWQAPARFDAVVFNLSFHHLAPPSITTKSLRRLLTPHGRIVCHELAYDRLDLAGATWYADVTELAATIGIGSDMNRPPDIWLRDWLAGFSERGALGFSAMKCALDAVAQTESLDWIPLLYLLVANRLLGSLPLAQGRRLVHFLEKSEHRRIAAGEMQAIGFRYVGCLRQRGLREGVPGHTP